jgi:hypothetical protein
MPVVELLVTRSKVNVKAVSNDMLTPLLCAMINNRPLVSSFLIHHEPGLLSIPDSNGDFPLHFAVLEGLADMVSSTPPSILSLFLSLSLSIFPSVAWNLSKRLCASDWPVNPTPNDSDPPLFTVCIATETANLKSDARCESSSIRRARTALFSPKY